MAGRALRNRTLTCSEEELATFSERLLRIDSPVGIEVITNGIIHGDCMQLCSYLPRAFIDLLILDPPYNLTKDYNGKSFRKIDDQAYAAWFRHILSSLLPLLKPDASIYICSDWRTSTTISPILGEFFHVHNRITWEREKGRGAKRNWKNNSEDIWFCTHSVDYYFDIEAVKVKRRVIAPYRDKGLPKDWAAEAAGNFRLTHPSNLWTDLSIPFWSMPENTDHPTQKPEKLLAKLILASCPIGGFVFDPFLGSGTSSVVAEKLGRFHCGIEIDETFCCWARKRLDKAIGDSVIQGYADGVFWERNSLSSQPKQRRAERGLHFC